LFLVIKGEVTRRTFSRDHFSDGDRPGPGLHPAGSRGNGVHARQNSFIKGIFFKTGDFYGEMNLQYIRVPAGLKKGEYKHPYGTKVGPGTRLKDENK
jgi:hypothetical protein